MPTALSGFVRGRGAGGRNGAEDGTAEPATAMERTFPEVQRGRQAARGIGYAISRRLGTARFDGGSRLWDSIVWEIPANREKNREFHRFSRFLQTTVPKTSANSAVCKMSSLPGNSQAAYAVWRVSPKCNSFLEKVAWMSIRRDEVG